MAIFNSNLLTSPEILTGPRPWLGGGRLRSSGAQCDVDAGRHRKFE